MNQLRCQKGKSECDGGTLSLQTILVGADGGGEAEADDFLRDRPKEPEEATVDRNNSEIEIGDVKEKREIEEFCDFDFGFNN